MAIIGPTFTDELRAAGAPTDGLSWAADTGRIEFHPDVPETARKKVRDVLATHDGALSQARHDAVDGIRAEAAKRMAALFDQIPGSPELIFAQINALTRALQAVEMGAGALPAERAELGRVKALWARGRAIRDVSAAAESAVMGATTEAAARSVKPVWPA